MADYALRHRGKDNDSRGDTLPVFSPMTLTMGEIREAIPANLFNRSSTRSLLYLFRDILMAAVAWVLASQIEPAVNYLTTTACHRYLAQIIQYMMWSSYWWFQGLIFTGIWVLGHECGHGAFSENKYLCDVIGFVTHTMLWTPYFSWKLVHHRHHANHASMERDEVYVPKTRADLGIPKEEVGSYIDYAEYLGDTPVYTLFMLVRQQLLAFPAYLLLNVSGQKTYPAWTNHFNPRSVLFTPLQRNAVLYSDFGILCMFLVVYFACSSYGVTSVVNYYGIPWLLVTHWFVMITYLHHTHQDIPHYRAEEWTFQRGAAATVDRDFLGWQGRFFLHDVAHFHVVHHFFPQLPWYNGEEATKYLRAKIGSHYMYSDKSVFKALWETYNNCQFVEDEGQSYMT
ncbi:hypothetical protein NEOLEDRAFT_1077503 [Neolentinus lepideus HHB14362 ss-1]|uniref:Fatty acid desaturase domain-containing protein n=1 Tax=Neolentinus lepideus HHB14362 ss-1 TaxID=1314782 RepID=A0A165NGL3_9AGAM|nr:hypothetical protein NEOLEDRAFT_1077503 [Neolentinus lepideus HHB14362 ss-1]